MVEIEEKLNETLTGETPYVNRVLEIIHNIKDKKNAEFRENIINGVIKPEDLCTMNAIDMLSKKRQKEIEEEKEKKVDDKNLVVKNFCEKYNINEKEKNKILKIIEDRLKNLK